MHMEYRRNLGRLFAMVGKAPAHSQMRHALGTVLIPAGVAIAGILGLNFDENLEPFNFLAFAVGLPIILLMIRVQWSIEALLLLKTSDFYADKAPKRRALLMPVVTWLGAVCPEIVFAILIPQWWLTLLLVGSLFLQLENCTWFVWQIASSSLVEDMPGD